MAVLDYELNSIRASLEAEGIAPADEQPEAYEAVPPEVRAVFSSPEAREHFKLPAPRAPQEIDMQADTSKWTTKFESIEAATPTAIDKAEKILRDLVAAGADQRRIDARGKQLVKTLSDGGLPKQSTTKEEREKPGPQQTMPLDPIGLLRDEAAALRIELADHETKMARLRLLERVLAAAEEGE